MSGQSTNAGAMCAHCGSGLRPSAPFCGACGHAVTQRQPVLLTSPTPVTAAAVSAVPASILAARPGVRCAALLLDLAAMLSPALPLAVIGTLLAAPEVIYTVVPVGVAAVWFWMHLWQGYTGMSFGKALLGLRLVRAVDQRAPGVTASIVHGGVFAGTLGFAALPLIAGPPPRKGLHDRLSGTGVIDIVQGANPLGPSPQTILRRTVNRGVNKVQSPVPVYSGRP